MRQGAIGDTIVIFPLLAALGRRFPAVQISALGRSEVWELARKHGLCSRVFSCDAIGWWTLSRDDAPIDPRLCAVLADTSVLIDLDGAAAMPRAEELCIPKILSIPALPSPDYGRPAARFYLERAGFPDDPPFVSIPRRDAGDPPLLAIAPGAGGRTKRAPADWFAAVSRDAQRRGLGVALVLGEADADAESEFAASGGACDLLWKNLPLSALLDRLRACSGFVANDSGVAHLAAFAGLPGFVHFAVTDPRVWCPPAPGIRWGRTQRDMLAFLEEVG